MVDARKAIEFFWPEPQPGDFLPAEPDEDILRPGDTVILTAPSGRRYAGIVKEVDPQDSTVFVHYWMREDLDTTGWWSFAQTEKVEATASTTIAS